jgi:hypothetical protein
MNRFCVAFALAACVIASPVRAQSIDHNGVPFRLWDFTTGVGLHFEDRADTFDVDETYGSWDGSSAFGVQAGRYWTSHLKTEAGFLYVAPTEFYGGDPIPFPDGVTRFATYRVRQQVTHFSGTLTYQFFDNVFAHPYVSAGAGIAIGSSHKSRDGFATGSTRGGGIVSDPIPPVDERRTVVDVRPLLAAGFKSYFNERTFVRSELSTAFSARGVTQVSLGLAFGVDF